jgi:ribosomal protein S18 acetylase RimI-like enzyme
LEITRRQANDPDTDFARNVHHQAYRDIVTRQYGVWDEHAQDKFFAEDWTPEKFEIICCDGIPCGYTRIEDRDKDIHIRELVILPDFQNRGIGSHILREVLDRAKTRKAPVVLGTHIANQAMHLYQRFGFEEFERTDTHILMKLPPASI